MTEGELNYTISDQSGIQMVQFSWAVEWYETEAMVQILDQKPGVVSLQSVIGWKVTEVFEPQR